jgi:UDP-2-acetamido-2,6-beta-L-arabino-hexul-4-ose reductase
MKVLITGANGFVGKNLKLFLKERSEVEIFSFLKEDNISSLFHLVSEVDFIFHLAGANRPSDIKEFTSINEILSEKLSDAVKKTNRKIPIIYTSSTQAALDNLYGISKRNAENILFNLNKNFKIPIYIFRLPNIFGKFSKPNYNSVVSTFCYNIARDIPILVKDPKNLITLVYIDDVIKKFINIMNEKEKKIDFKDFEIVSPSYQITVEDLAKQLYAFKEMRNFNVPERVETGLAKALYSTYISYLP